MTTSQVGLPSGGPPRTEPGPSGPVTSVTASRWLLMFAWAFPLLLGGYLFLDRGFAWLHVPGTPVFIAEVVLALGVLGVLTTPLYSRSAMAKSLPLMYLLAFTAWGAFLALPRFTPYGFDAIRDSALWYYGLVAFLVFIVFSSIPGTLGRWLSMYRFVLPFLVIWLPISVAICGNDVCGTGGWLTVPDSQVSLLSHKSGNVAVQAASAVAFIALVRPVGQRLSRRAIFITVLGMAAVLFAAARSRGGMLAAGFGLVAALGMARLGRRQMIAAVGAVLALLLATAAVVDFQVPLSGNRTASVGQIASNIQSVVSPETSNSSLVSTADWRVELWKDVTRDVSVDYPLAGYGFGVNIREVYGQQDEQPPARGPHSSHVNVFARMGLPGVALWLLLWGSWFVTVAVARRRLLRSGDSLAAGTAAWLMVVASMVLINAMFDPTLESPQKALWTWAVFGAGAWLVSASRHHSEDLLELGT